MYRPIFFSILFSSILFTQCHDAPVPKLDAQQSVWEEKQDVYPNGTVSRHYWLLAGKKDSVMTTFDREGIKTGELRFRNDLQEGRSIFYFPSGKIKEEQFYKAGKREGCFITWFESGQKQVSTDYHEGRIHGFFRKWNPDGSLIIESVFQHDSLIEVKYKQRL